MKEIRSNYKTLMSKWHPDTCKEDKKLFIRRRVVDRTVRE
ncbi:MAG: hypothetical protein R6V04_08490 [bacterium]